MSKNAIIKEFEKSYFQERPEIKIGDTVQVHLRIIEGEKERTQVFAGTVIAKKGRGLAETFSIYRNAYGCSMERVFPLHSPRISKITKVRSGKVRKSKLYYLRGTSGKAARLGEKIHKEGEVETVAVENAVPVTPETNA